MKTIVSTSEAPAAIGPYSQAVKANGFVFVSGQIPIDPATGSFAAEDVVGQTRQCLVNLSAILKAAGSSLEKVVKATVYLQDINDFAAVNEEYAAFFTNEPPARAAFGVAALPKGALVEIEAIAIL